ncbi:hypothetical protein CXG81DRAFT_16008, partial [Caulochytrium protostelioides]
MSESSSVLMDMITAACDPMLPEPNLSLNLEICDFINHKQRGTPREAAFVINRYINGRHPSSSLHALTLLDYCVKNCGYPFHLAISSKEYLNNLVRKFPEHPIAITPVQNKILDLIQQWNAALCTTESRFREDFRHINDMYRLLSYKGYRFPTLNATATAILANKSELKTEEQLEREDQIAHGAKLQELLRIGTPAALDQANHLMKIMAGYDMKQRPDYAKQVEDELARVHHRVMSLNDMIHAKRPEQRHDRDSLLHDAIAAVKSSQTSVQKMIGEVGSQDGSDNGERMSRLLELNDQMNAVIDKVSAWKAG